MTGTRLAELGRELAVLWRWWLAELVGLLPGPLRRLLGPPPVLVADPAGETFHFALRREGRETPFAGDPRRAGRAVWLRLPPDAVLTRRLDWPAMAAGDLRRAIRLDLDRQTPAGPAALWFDVAVRARDPGTRRITIDLAVARAAEVAALSDRLRAHHGVAAARVGAAPADTPGAIRFDLRPGAAEPAGDASTARRLPLPRTTRGRLALAAVLLGLLNLGLFWSAMEDRRAALDAAVADARRRAVAVEQLRTSVAERRRLRDEIVGRGGGASLLAVLDELTRLVPDTAWLDSVEVRGGSVYVTGFAPAAVTLVALIERSPMFADAQFRSPVVPDRGTGLERFDMTIGLKGRSG